MNNDNRMDSFKLLTHYIHICKINRYFTKNKSCFLFELELYQTIVYARAFLIIIISYDYDIMIIYMIVMITIMTLSLDLYDFTDGYFYTHIWMIFFWFMIF